MNKTNHPSVTSLLEGTTVLTNQLLDANEEIEALKARIQKMEETKPEPSRLEVALMIRTGMLASHYVYPDPNRYALREADALIAALKETQK